MPNENLDNKTLRRLETQTDDKPSFVEKVDNEIKVKFYPDSPTQRVHKDAFLTKTASKFYDPCAKSSQMAIRCMENHDEDYKEVCGEYFRAFRECKKEWMKERRKDGGIW
ncbi:hypothetical protein KL921_001870 [Ogataea angusta]|uniref:Cytochrome c oxidase-assembly factor COX23, mitochondrial n=1 Tax=Pichia angusta TaxID=870730 RepID=A0AAN6DIR0_PICAN|nr:uncharacterized protein KL928_002054 [Ogataea angusta]KAG7811604.1 hypothetical protein KL921_001870 [Ogataea angusta]KAG7819380.1 hypothetical protein KL928_002054 [Ogataea angusta]KAG7824161.1 hypothetical protein KL909_002159 [Ogataea angusta]